MKGVFGGRGVAFAASMLVLVLTGVFLFYALTLRQGPVGPQTPYRAVFISASGLQGGDDVALDGVVVGRVNDVVLNTRTDMADVAFTVDQSLKLPVDTAVTIGALGIGGNNALQLLPGKSQDLLKPGAVITNARPLLSLEQQISNYIFGAGKL
ncbi:MCE family protein [Oecophyllibacter saccharovorans]|uniref:MlaD family protein n=1 Tax=Oecophyllibacter saccharovorans TaxID=2558360 RepID=UPI00114204C8|nr:MlaD family protein [Oecophyllibacter saccharovorans]QDH14590.1 MCE family protein [Oecophyllibacter saccharovorans]